MIVMYLFSHLYLRAYTISWNCTHLNWLVMNNCSKFIELFTLYKLYYQLLWAQLFVFWWPAIKVYAYSHWKLMWLYIGYMNLISRDYMSVLWKDSQYQKWKMKEIKHNYYSLINSTLGCRKVLEATDQGIKGVHIRV